MAIFLDEREKMEAVGQKDSQGQRIQKMGELSYRLTFEPDVAMFRKDYSLQALREFFTYLPRIFVPGDAHGRVRLPVFFAAWI
jgi:hypothetical protein